MILNKFVCVNVAVAGHWGSMGLMSTQCSTVIHLWKNKDVDGTDGCQLAVSSHFPKKSIESDSIGRSSRGKIVVSSPKTQVRRMDGYCRPSSQRPWRWLFSHGKWTTWGISGSKSEMRPARVYSLWEMATTRTPVKFCNLERFQRASQQISWE